MVAESPAGTEDIRLDTLLTAPHRAYLTPDIHVSTSTRQAIRDLQDDVDQDPSISTMAAQTSADEFGSLNISASYIESLEDDSEFSTTSLPKFLRGKFSELNIPYCTFPESTRIAILDYREDNVSCRELPIPVQGAVSREFEAFLAYGLENPSRPSLRMIFWQADELQSMNPAYMNHIAARYRLDPNFLSAHLEKASHYLKTHLCEFSVPPLSERRFLQIVHDLNHFMSLQWTVSDDIETSTGPNNLHHSK